MTIGVPATSGHADERTFRMVASHLTERDSLSVVNTPDLAALVPRQLARHPTFEWTILSGLAPEEDLVVELYPRDWPERVATVQVNPGAEVFSVTFAGHVCHGFAYRDQDRPETLQDLIDIAAEAASGPTRVTRDCRNGIIVRSTLVVDPDGPHRSSHVVSYPLRRLKSFFGAGRRTREVDDFPAARCS